MRIYSLRFMVLLLLGVLSSITKGQQQADLMEGMLKHLVDSQNILVKQFKGFTSDMMTMKTTIATLMLNEVETRSDIRKLKESLRLEEGPMATINTNVEHTNSEVGLIKTMLTSVLGTLMSVEEKLNDTKDEQQAFKGDILRLLEITQGTKATIEAFKSNIASFDGGMQLDQPQISESSGEVMQQFNMSNEGISSPRDCKAILKNGGKDDGVYKIFPEGMPEGVEAYCDQQTAGGGWTVFLIRGNQSPPEDFTRTFEEYAAGFGTPVGEFWLGNRIVNRLTADHPHTLRVEAQNLKGETRHATWGSFSVGGEDTQFTLSIDNYIANSTLGNGLNNADGKSWQSNNMKFTTVDKNNGKKCARVAGKGGWWYDSCYGANPTARIASRNNDDETMNWYYWENNGTTGYTGLTSVLFMIRPL